MICKGCGLPLKAGDVFCGNCGTKVETTPVAQPMQQPAVSQPSGNKGLGITSMILGICSIVFSWLAIFAIILPIVGLILASKAKGNKFAKIGKITSIIGLVLVIISTIAWFAFMGFAQSVSQSIYG